MGEFLHSNYVMGTENMEILKVVIADDEVRICQLIQALIDWDSMGMKVVGIAHNGEEACEIVRQTQPDILITDIRMPGCSGLELVKRVKELDSALEVIIISGYAHFEYAQQAISYGVGHYLLKPVNKGELTATLQKLQKKIGERKESELNHQELVNKAKRDDDHLRANLIDRLLDQPDMPVSQDTLTSIYHLKARQGVYQAFCVKVDYGRKIISGGRMDGTTGLAGGREISSTSSEVLMEKVREVLERNLKNDSRELILLIRDDYCYGILNYPESEKESIRRSMKSSLTQMEIQKNMFQHVSFSMAVGAAYKEAEHLADSMQEARKLIQERLVKGDGRVLDCMGKASEIQESELLKKYLREITHAVEISSIQNAAEAVEDLQDTVNKAKEIRGSEIFELVYAAADIFAASIRIPERTATVEEFRKQCDKCGKRFTTYEKVEVIPLIVIKKDRNREPFDRDKVAAGVYGACHKRPIPAEKINKLIDDIETIVFNREEKEIESSEIGNIVMDKLNELDQVAYVRFASVYREFKDVNTFIDELKKILDKK